MKYTLTNTILEQSFKFSKIYGALSAQDMSSPWIGKLREATVQKAGFAAVSIDQSRPKVMNFTGKHERIEKYLSDGELVEYSHYTKVLEEVKKNCTGVDDLSVELISKLHADILGNEHASNGNNYRRVVRFLPKVIKENDVYKTIMFEVKTRPQDIPKRLDNFIALLNKNYQEQNVLLLAGICHYKIAAIHPFSDGNGRVSRVFENYVLYEKGIHHYDLLPTEDFHLRNRERYYDLIEETIARGDLTQWLEFYMEALLDSVHIAADMLYKISGGTIDIIANKYISLTEKEAKMVEILNNLGQASGAEIAKTLGVSRQNINAILKKLHGKKLLKKIGKNTSSRYELANRG